jgi:hypothetical protein
MEREGQDSWVTLVGAAMNRRALLRGVVGAGTLVPLGRRSEAEIWEEGDIQCRPIVQEKEPAYEINDALLVDFMNLSELLTGVKPLDTRLGVQYLERYARNPDLTVLLPQLIKAYRDIASQSDLPKAIQENIMHDSTVGPAAEQLIYLWYVSAFFLPIDHTAASRNWLYGSPEQYQKSLLWTVVHAHAPMMEGGPPGYWAAAPRI